MTYNPDGLDAVAIDHYEHPRNVGEMQGADAVAIATNPACGDRMQLWLRIHGGVIEEATFKTYGCSAAIAASSMTTELLRGRRIDEAQALTNASVAEALRLPPGKIHCSVLAEEAVKAALDDYRARPAQAQGLK